MSLHLKLSELFMNQVAETKEGRAWILTQMADAEGGEGGELQVFEALEAYVDDEKLQKMITIHKDDELRHEALFRERVAALGVPSPIIPREQKLLLRLDDAVQIFKKPIASDAAVLDAYLVLLVVEERATAQFAMTKRVFEKRGDHETARVLDEVERDEARHLKYCHAITKRYAANESERQKRIDEIRTLEARIFLENGRGNVRYALERGFIQSAPWRAFWKTLQALTAKRSLIPPTAFEEMREQGLVAA
jgi:rubrerythrin